MATLPLVVSVLSGGTASIEHEGPASIATLDKIATSIQVLSPPPFEVSESFSVCSPMPLLSYLWLGELGCLARQPFRGCSVAVPALARLIEATIRTATRASLRVHLVLRSSTASLT